MKNKIFMIIGIVISIILFIIADSPSLQNEKLGDLNIRDSQEWIVTHSTDDDYIIRIGNKNKQDTEICLIHKTEKNPLNLNPKDIYDKEGKIIETIQPSITSLSESANAGYCYDLVKMDYLKFGVSTIIEYQDINKLEYQLDFAQVNITLYKNTSNGYNNTINDIWIRTNPINYKFGAYDSSNKGVENYKYRFESTLPIIENGWRPYIYTTSQSGRPSRTIQQRHEFWLFDICGRNFSNNRNADCELTYSTNEIDENTTIYVLEVIFNSDKNIDPSIQITEFSDMDSITTNITQENNFTHLEISDIAPYDSLVLYMPFDDNQSTTTAYDYTNDDNDGAINGDAIYNSSGLYDGAMQFDNDADWVLVGDDSSLDFLNNFTILAWIYTKTINDKTHRILHKNSAYTFGITSSGSRLSTFHYGEFTSDFSNSDVLTIDTWYHVAVTIDSITGIDFYVNGQSEGGNVALTADVPVNANDVYIGLDEDETNLDFNGFIDELMVFNATLTATQISDIYNNQSGRFKEQGIQELKQFNMTLDSDWVLIQETTSTPGGSSISKSLGEWELSLGYNNTDMNASEDALVGYWHADGDATDSSGLGNHGTFNGSANANADGVWNRGFAFDGDGDYIEVADDDSLDLSTEATWSLWVKRAQYTDLGGLLNKYHSAGRRAYTLLEATTGDSTEIGLFLSPNGASPDIYYTTNDCAPVDDEWTYIAVTYDEGLVIFYKNGVQCDTDSYSVTSIHNSPEPLLIGSSYDSDFNGTIDDVMIFNRSLSTTEIKELYVKGRALYNYSSYQTTNYFHLNNRSSTNFKIDYKFKAGATSSFYTPLLKVSSSDPITGSSTSITNCTSYLLTAGETYTQQNNIIHNSLTSDCIVILDENITFNGNGYFISSDDDYTGIYSNQMNTTIKNSNVSIFHPTSIGIELDSANNSYIFNNTLMAGNTLELNNVYNTIIEKLTTYINSFPMEAVKFTSSSHNIISNSSLTCYGASCYGVDIVSGANNTIKNTTITSDSGPGDYGVYLGDNSNIVQDSNISGFDFGIYLNANSNRVFRNTIENNVIAVQINGKDFNVLENNTIFGCSDTGADTGCVYLADGSDRNNMTGGSLDADSDELYGVFISSDTSASANNRFRDFTIEPQFIITRGGVKMSGSSAGLNNVFLNVTYNSTWTVINSCSSCELVRKWYYRAYVNDTLGNDVSNANVSAYDVSDVYQFNLTTNNTGYTPIGEIIDYVNVGGTKTNYDAYTIYAVNDSYNLMGFSYSVSTNNLKHVLTLDNVVPTINITKPLNGTSFTLPYINILLNISATDNLGISAYWWSKDGGVINTTFFNNQTLMSWDVAEGETYPYTITACVNDTANNQKCISTDITVTIPTSTTSSVGTGPSSTSTVVEVEEVDDGVPFSIFRIPEPLDIRLKIYYYREGNRIPFFYLNQTYDGISFEVVGRSDKYPISNLSILNAIPIEFRNSLPDTIQELRIRQTRTLWESEIIGINNFEIGESVTFQVSVMGTSGDENRTSLIRSGKVTLTIGEIRKNFFYDLGERIWSGKPLYGLFVGGAFILFMGFLLWKYDIFNKTFNKTKAWKDTQTKKRKKSYEEEEGW